MGGFSFMLMLTNFIRLPTFFQCRGLVVITTTKLHAAYPEFGYSVGSIPTCIAVCDFMFLYGKPFCKNNHHLKKWTRKIIDDNSNFYL